MWCVQLCTQINILCQYIVKRYCKNSSLLLCGANFILVMLSGKKPNPALPAWFYQFQWLIFQCSFEVSRANTLSQKQRIFPRNTSECIWEQVPWPVNFQGWFNPSPFENFQKHLTLFPSEISEKFRDKMKINSASFDPLSS